MKGSFKTDSIKINRVNGCDIYLDPENGEFFFTLKTEDKPRVRFATLRAAEDAARGDRPPITVVVVGNNFYQHPEVVEVIGFSNWNLVTTTRKRISLYRVYAYDQALITELNEAASDCGRAQQRWQQAVESMERSGLKIEVDTEDRIKVIDGDHKRAEGGILRCDKD